jgi:hypothetical protein
VGGSQNSFSAILLYLAVTRLWLISQDLQFDGFRSTGGYDSNGSISTKIDNSGYLFFGGFNWNTKLYLFNFYPP